MAVAAPARETAVDLAVREAAGYEVTLLWYRDEARVAVAVKDSRTGSSVEFEVDEASALDAFRHPFAYRSY
jgi:hypothetical protein